MPAGTRDRRLVRGKTKTEVANKLKALREERDSGVVGDGRLLTVEVWSKRWIKAGQHLKPRTLAGYQQYLDNYVVPRLGEKQLSKLSRTDCEHFFTSLAKQ